jgi:phosphate starvation-inducible PhoH-like protein
MKMFLTRIGQDSKVIITADESQIDLPDPKKSGIFTAVRILDGIKNIKIMRLTKNDVIRHNLVKKIIEAYESYLNRNKRQNK